MSSIQSIIIRPERRAEPLHVYTAKITSFGIDGDHSAKQDGRRQVTLITGNNLAIVAATVGFRGDAHLACRRNIMIDTSPLSDLNGKVVGLGNEVILEITGYCNVCNRMEENFGSGAIDAFSDKGGWVARVILGGSISIGDRFFLR